MKEIVMAVKRLPVKRNPVARALIDPRFHQRTVAPRKGKGASYTRKGRVDKGTAPSDSKAA